MTEDNMFDDKIVLTDEECTQRDANGTCIENYVNRNS